MAVLLTLERLGAFERFRLWRNRAGHGKRASWDEACAESFGHAEAGREAGRRGQRGSDHVVLLLLAKTGEHVAQRRVLGFLVRCEPNSKDRRRGTIVIAQLLALGRLCWRRRRDRPKVNGLPRQRSVALCATRGG